MTKSLRIAAVDLNGQLRGKRVATDMAAKQMRMPLSVLNIDIFGADIEGSPLIFKSGDQDGIMEPVGREPIPLPWVAGDALLDLRVMYNEDGTPFKGDPRIALTNVLDRFLGKGWQVIAACELEFFLLEDGGNLTPPINPKTGRRLSSTEILSMRELDGFDAFFNDVTEGARVMGLGNLTITGEAGIGQFEVTMAHGPALHIADNVILLKELIKGTARNHKMAATFMAKPFPAESGNGLHTHFSVLNAVGKNIFCNEALLESAVAGCLQTFEASTLFFAPYANSFERFVTGAHAPTSATWGYENRTVAVRIPGGPTAAKRIEHRVAGGDANPYLMFAAIFGAALEGIEVCAKPPTPITGNAYTQPAVMPGLLPNLTAAINGLDNPLLTKFMPAMILENLAATKTQEHDLFEKMSDHEALLALVDTA
jgi:glutamine synthetase